MQKLCSYLLLHLSSSSSSSSSSIPWSQETKAIALTSLRILARESHGAGQLTSRDGLATIAALAELSSDVGESCFAAGAAVPLPKINGE